jgi:hypothetical protein
MFRPKHQKGNRKRLRHTGQWLPKLNRYLFNFWFSPLRHPLDRILSPGPADPISIKRGSKPALKWTLSRGCPAVASQMPRTL